MSRSKSRGAEGRRDIVTDPYKVLVLTESICRSLSQLTINPTAEVNSR
ncbi:hypothetical protein CSC33_3287 [Pseudomonas aeruginosa]|nr:hypothetical protein CSC33_3287 [Pseudomonas aeruginosa]